MPSDWYFIYAFDKLHSMKESYLTAMFPSSDSSREKVNHVKDRILEKISSIKKIGIFRIRIPSVFPIFIVAVIVIVFYLTSLNTSLNITPSIKIADDITKKEKFDFIDINKITDLEKLMKINPDIKEIIKQHNKQKATERNKKDEATPKNKDSTEQDKAGYGSESDPNLLGQPERTDVQKKPEYIDPLINEGATKLKDKLIFDEGQMEKSPIVQEKEQLKKYFHKYKTIAEETMEKENFSENSRALVKKYFDVIKD